MYHHHHPGGWAENRKGHILSQAEGLVEFPNERANWVAYQQIQAEDDLKWRGKFGEWYVCV
jgi:hypothetical protein